MTNTLRCVATLAAWPVILLCIVLTGCAARPAPAAPAPRAADLVILDHTGLILDALVATLDEADAERQLELADRQARLSATVAGGTSLAVLTARGDASLALTERAGAVCARLAAEDSDLWWECVDGFVSDYCRAEPGDLACVE